MLVDAAVADGPLPESRRFLAEGQEIEGADAELEVGLGHAVALEDAEAPAEPQEAPEPVEEPAVEPAVEEAAEVPQEPSEPSEG